MELGALINQINREKNSNHGGLAPYLDTIEDKARELGIMLGFLTNFGIMCAGERCLVEGHVPVLVEGEGRGELAVYALKQGEGIPHGKEMDHMYRLFSQEGEKI